MVYSAWMRQAMDGHFLFDNRFTTDPQPGLTVHLYFWILGLIAKLTGIPFAANLARLFFTGLFAPLLYRLVKRVSGSVFVTRLAVTLTILGGGIGFVMWHNFGVESPIDVWQPEAFVFPSMLTNGLFMVSLCLILFIFQSFLDARTGWKPVAQGAIAVGILMNIHSYDVVIVAITMVGFLTMQIARKQLDGSWLMKGLMIGAGAIPAALWFVHVLQSDPVFQARAATLTYSANFRWVFYGYLLMFLLALPGLFVKLKGLKARIGIGLFVLLLLGLFFAADTAGKGYFLTAPIWAGVFAVAICGLVLVATEDVTLNLLLSWAMLGIVALYFPALFQRKLAMGLSVPWAILATLGFAELVRAADRNSRNLATVLVILVLSGSAIRWLTRDKVLIDSNLSNTTMHPVFLSRDERQILSIIDRDPRPRKVVIAMPGVTFPEDQNGIPQNVVPDLNPIATGLAGAYTYAGHWSETPSYNERRSELTALFWERVPEEAKRRILAKIAPDYIIQPAQETFGPTLARGGFDLSDLSPFGQVVYSGGRFKLIAIKR